MTMVICPINKIHNTGTIPYGQRVLTGQIPMVKGSQMDFTLIDHGEMSNVQKVPILILTRLIYYYVTAN